MYRKGSTSYTAAKERAFELFDKGLNSPAVYHVIEKEFPQNKRPPDVRSIYRWRHDWMNERERKQVLASMTSDKAVTAEGKSESIEYNEPERKASLKLVKAPTIDKLIKQGVPKEFAPRLLLNWDIAYDEGKNYRTHICQKVAAIYGEFPDIPFERAWTFASMELSAVLRHSEFATKFAYLFRRYRPWQGRENQEAFNKMADHWNIFRKPETDAKKGSEQLLSKIRP